MRLFNFHTTNAEFFGEGLNLKQTADLARLDLYGIREEHYSKNLFFGEFLFQFLFLKDLSIVSFDVKIIFSASCFVKTARS